MRLNRGLFCLLFLGVLAFSGCSDDEWEGLKVFDGTFFEIGSEGEQLRIPVRSSSEWVLPETGKVVRDTAGEWRESRYVGAGRGSKYRPAGTGVSLDV